MIKLGQINMVNIHYNGFVYDCFCHHDTILIDHGMNSQRKRQNGSTTKIQTLVIALTNVKHSNKDSNEK